MWKTNVHQTNLGHAHLFEIVRGGVIYWTVKRSSLRTWRIWVAVLVNFSFRVPESVSKVVELFNKITVLQRKRNFMADSDVWVTCSQCLARLFSFLFKHPLQFYGFPEAFSGAFELSLAVAKPMWTEILKKGVGTAKTSSHVVSFERKVSKILLFPWLLHSRSCLGHLSTTWHLSDFLHILRTVGPLIERTLPGGLVSCIRVDKWSSYCLRWQLAKVTDVSSPRCPNFESSACVVVTNLVLWTHLETDELYVQTRL